MTEALNEGNLGQYAGFTDIARYRKSLAQGNLLYGLTPDEYIQLEAVGRRPDTYSQFLAAVKEMTGIDPDQVKFATFSETVLTILPNRDVTTKP